jgi:MerR family transcriptional regulator, copper efflux regulator
MLRPKAAQMAHLDDCWMSETEQLFRFLDTRCCIGQSSADLEIIVELTNLDTTVVMLGEMEALTIHEAAQTTGWSPRMLRYVERAGLVSTNRSASGYRLYGPAELQRLRTLKELLAHFDIGLSDVAFAARMADSPELRQAVQAWLDAQARRPEHVDPQDWLQFEKDKHQRLLEAA